MGTKAWSWKAWSWKAALWVHSVQLSAYKYKVHGQFHDCFSFKTPPKILSNLTFDRAKHKSNQRTKLEIKTVLPPLQRFPSLILKKELTLELNLEICFCSQFSRFSLFSKLSKKVGKSWEIQDRLFYLRHRIEPKFCSESHIISVECKNSFLNSHWHF